MNRRISFGLFAIFFLTAGCDNTIFPLHKNAPLVTDQQTFTRQIEVSPTAKIVEAHHRGGNITIVGWDQPYILVEGTTRASGETVEMARATIEMVQVIAYEHPQNRLVLDYEGPEGFGRGKNPDERIDYTANIPRGMVIDLQSENGAASISKIDNDVFIDHKLGDLQVEEIKGAVSAKITGPEKADCRAVIKSIGRGLSLTSSKINVEVSQITGDAQIHHSNGEALVFDVDGKLTYRGDKTQAQLTRIQGFLKLNNSGGDVLCNGFYDGINAEMKDGTLKLEPKVQVTRGYECNVVKGNLIFRIPDNSSMLLEIMAINGSINSEYPLQVSAEGKTSFAKGAIGQGFPQVHLDVERGSVSILREIPTPNSSDASLPPSLPSETIKTSQPKTLSQSKTVTQQQTNVAPKEPIPVSSLQPEPVKKK